MAERIKLYIDNEYCLSLEQLRGYFARDLNPETDLYKDLLTWQRDGMLQLWLEQGTTDDEQQLARQLKDLSYKQGNTELMGELTRIFIGHVGQIHKPNPSNYLELKSVQCVTARETIELERKDENYLGSLYLRPDRIIKFSVKLVFVFKIKAIENEIFTLRLKSEDTKMANDFLLSLSDYRAGENLTIEFPFVMAGRPKSLFQLWVDSERWTTIDLETFDDERVFTVEGVSFKMIYIEGGRFRMGATDEQKGFSCKDEEPCHDVTLSSYLMGETAVKQELWQIVMGDNPSHFSGGNRPVESVDWDDCITFINKLNEILKDDLRGKKFRLPTEAEWEYAAREGKTEKGNSCRDRYDLSKVAVFDRNWSERYDEEEPYYYETQEVKTRSANDLGLFDMLGNVNEWCQDWYGNYTSEEQTNPRGPSSSDKGHVCRGGCYFDVYYNCRVSKRDYALQGRSTIGLRLAL